MCPQVAHLHRSLPLLPEKEGISYQLLGIPTTCLRWNWQRDPHHAWGCHLADLTPRARSTWRTRGKARLVRRNKPHQAALKTLKSCKARRQLQPSALARLL